MRTLVAAAIAMVLGTSTVQARYLPVPADKGWEHAETGLVLTAKLAGLPRIKISDTTDSEADVAAQFEDPGQGIIATIYVFHPAIPDVPLWFDRSSTAIATSDVFRHTSPASAEPLAFAAPGSTTASSLRQAFSVLQSSYRSTELALMPLGEWIVAVRLSAKSLTADALDARLQQLIAEIGWPAQKGAPAPVAVPIKSCVSPLPYTKAKIKKSDSADMLATLMMASILANNKAESKVDRQVWCRDGVATNEYAVYRGNLEEGGYVLAIADAGRVVTVAPSLMKKREYTVSSTDVDGTVATFPSFASLPQPAQVFDLVAGGRARGSSKGNNITIDPNAL